ncbi:hypothetical protein GE09DRAFT_1054545 [Coniochaeta sp. 2T2.1]|nr:hypothetical protein GE09DRAFT_1054545 [Coniochaeta sp. 2T2.1]
MPDAVSTNAPVFESTISISPDTTSQYKDKRVKTSASTNTPNTTVSSTDQQPVKIELRSASRICKSAYKQHGNEPVQERKTRKSYNIVEKQYRNRLNAQSERLSDALPATVRPREERENLENEFDELRNSLDQLKDAFQRHPFLIEVVPLPNMLFKDGRSSIVPHNINKHTSENPEKGS